jgi:ribosomal protein S18 acetylase RimI-like enzyme
VIPGEGSTSIGGPPDVMAPARSGLAASAGSGHASPMTDIAEPAAHPGGPWTIRPVTPDDPPALKAVIDATGLFPSDMLDGMVAGYLDGGGGDEFWLTVEDDGAGPVAVAYCAPEQMTQGTWNLLLIAVHPDRQGQGRGAALLRHVERTLAERGERVLLVETSGLPAFERTRAFYRRCGYDEEARIRDFYRAGEDKVVFRKVLGAARAGGVDGSGG